MQQTPEKPRGPAAYTTHTGRRPPRSIITAAPPQPEQYPDQRPTEDDINDWVSVEGGQVDPLFVPPQMKRAGFAYQWVVTSALGCEDSIIKRRLTTFYRAGWRPVPGERGRGYYFLPGESIPATCEIGGQLLMERPAHIEKHARDLNLKAARGQLRDKMVEVGMASPENVRAKIIKHEIDAHPDYLQAAPQGDGYQVPE